MLNDFDTDVISSGCVMPGQIPAGQRLDGDVSGERALMLAILEDAARCIANGRGRRRYALRVLAADAAAWVGDDDRTWPFSFVNICEVLGVDADAVRARLLRPDVHRARPRARLVRSAFPTNAVTTVKGVSSCSSS